LPAYDGLPLSEAMLRHAAQLRQDTTDWDPATVESVVGPIERCAEYAD
jgi:hypothetical protein